ncbi:MAG: DUF1893 domain-containing protein [Clostridia bacterium]|nr:DUF1893 domain-containing protein [Clostridia bacterium]
MDKNTLKAKNILIENDYTCVLCCDNEEYHSNLRGVKPLLDFLESDKDFSGFSAADKTVGAGAAHLYVLLNVKAVWVNIISTAGKKILSENNITVFCETEVPYIINRKGDGMCPIETAVKDITSSQKALEAIKQTLKTLSK